MITIIRADIYNISDYSAHLKSLPPEDRVSRFGYLTSDYNIDQFMLQMVYNPPEHELWMAHIDGKTVGWGHMAKNNDQSWELAVSVNHDLQRKGIGGKLIGAMLSWAKVHQVTEVFMHCIEDNKVIQHLAGKFELKTKSRGAGERTAALIVPEPTIYELTDHRWQEQKEIFNDFGKLRDRLTKLWSVAILPK